MKRSRKRPEAHPLALFRDVMKERVTLVAAGASGLTLEVGSTERLCWR
jgi:hypothetical protein